MIQLLMVTLTVLIGIASALLLDYSAGLSSRVNLELIAIFAFVFFVNVIRFVLWGWVHRRYDLSKSYPLTAVFFPMIYAVSLIQGEAVIEWSKLAGVALIVGGIFGLQVKQTV